MIIGILPHVVVTGSAKSAYSGTKRLTVDPTGSRRKVVEKRLLPYWWIRSNWVAYSRLWSRRHPSRCYGRAPKFLGQKRSVHFSKGILLHIRILNHKSVALMLQYLRTYIRKWREMSTHSKKRTKPHSTHLQQFGRDQRHLRRNPRTKNLW